MATNKNFIVKNGLDVAGSAAIKDNAILGLQGETLTTHIITTAASADGYNARSSNLNLSTGSSTGAVGGGDIYFTTGHAGYNGTIRYSLAERMRIKGYNGRVGIGTTSPASKLDIKGSGTTTEITLQTQNSSGTVGLKVLDSGDASVSGTLTANSIAVTSNTVVSNLNADLLDGQQGSYYASISSPTFTGTPSAPTPIANTNTTQIATTEFVQSIVGNIETLLAAL